MSHQPVIDGLEFAKAASKLQGAWPAAGFVRLLDALRTKEGTLSYELQGVPEAYGRPALRLKVDGVLPLVCQRCLGSLEYPLHIEELLLLVSTQAEVDTAPLDAQGPESIVAGREMQVLSLVEDEVLLAIPIAPRHPACAGDSEGSRGAKPMPFAGLRGLMGGLKH